MPIRPTLAMLVLPTALAACTGGSQSDGAEQAASTSTTAPTASSALDGSDTALMSDQFLDSGPGSLVAALLPLRADDLFRERGWQRTGVPVARTGSPCPEPAGVAEIAGTFVDTATFDQVTISVVLFDDDAGAEQAVAELTELTPECAEATAAVSKQIWSEIGLGDVTIDDPLGELIDPLVPVPGASTRLRTLESPIGSMTASDTVYQEGQLLVGISVGTVSDSLDLEAQADLVTAVRRAQQAHVPIRFEPDPELDAAIDRLRSVATEQRAPANYSVVGGIGVWVPDAGTDVLLANCRLDGSPTTSLAITGPTFGAANNSSLFLDGWAMSSPNEAERFAGDLAEKPIVCDASNDPATFTVTDPSARTERSGSHELSIATAMMQPQTGDIPGGGLRFESVRVAVGSQVLAWTFLGIDGDQPDLVALAVSAADLLQDQS